MKNSRFRGVVCWIGFVLLPAVLVLLVFGVVIQNYKRAFVENEVRQPAPPPEICITRFYSDTDGGELELPLVQHYDGQKVRDYRGVVIVRYIDGGGYEVTVMDSDGMMNWLVKDVVEFQKYIDSETKVVRKWKKSMVSGRVESLELVPVTSFPAGQPSGTTEKSK